MNISKVIREQRNQLSLSQEELAEKLYVTRQTIGNWENDKSYPDIHSLILLSQIFDMTIDNLVKGDLEVMKKTVEKKDVNTAKRNAWLCGCIGVVVILGSFNISTYLLSTHFIVIPSIIVSTLLFVGAFYFGIKSGLINRKNALGVLTYREIISFTNGKTLDEIAKARTEEKWHPVILSALIMTGFILAITHGVIWFLSVL
ncbi:MAG: helix-turn-helix domain-containing protein [Oscillospiraceae bacterium]|nr:helix-turn-helix domain-containing protein [Oscillospiraceae bacterium]